MSAGDSLLQRIADRDREIKILLGKTNEMKKKKSADKAKLAEWMKKKGLDEYKGVQLKNLQPKKRQPRKTIDQKRKAEVAILASVGAPNPEEVWERMQMTKMG